MVVMKKSILWLITGLLFFLACSSDSAKEATASIPIEKAQLNTVKTAQESVVMISDTSVGPFYKGAFIDANQVFKGSKLVEQYETIAGGDQKFYYRITEEDQESLKIYPAFDPRTETYSKLIGSISVVSDKYKDDHGISVGSTVGDFYSSYPSAYAYYNPATKEIVLSDEGHGPRYIVNADAIKNSQQLDISKIQQEQITQDAKITQIRIVRSNYENQDAMKNKGMEAVEILEDYLETICGQYYLKEFSENYYKIHKLQGDFLVSDCREDECKSRGKIIGCKKNKNMISLGLEDISGEMVPSWTIISNASGMDDLHVHDYDAYNDKWTDKVYTKADR